MTHCSLFRFSLLVSVSASLAATPPASAQKPDPLITGFTAPPEATRPRCYWYWMDGNFTKAGITKDLEAMKKVGVGEAYIGIIAGQAGSLPAGVKVFSEPWWELVKHAIREGGRLGVDIGMFNSPGWSQSGGPWIKPQQSMRHVVTSEIRLHGPQRFEGALPTPAGMVNDIATIAFPAPKSDTDTISKHNPKISGDARNSRLFDGDLATSTPAPAGG
ncbi:glycoside hydrolase family 2, partial [bacterium]